jgi:peptidoglycan/xylan/chitin deacetylase (PgdA/CDA1 family)
MRAVMYHYVRTYESAFPFFRYLDFDNFRRQLDYFEAEYGYVTYEEWCDFVGSGVMPIDSGKVLLTFDDALRCHYDYVFPELLRRNLWGIFYVPTSPYSEDLVLDVHRIHLLCGSYSGVDLLGVANSLIDEDMIPGEKIDEFRNRTYARQENAAGVSEFKRLMNYFVDYRHRTFIINEVAKNFGFIFRPQNFYVSLKSFHEMRQHGMIIGSHSHSHPVMSRLAVADQKIEVEKSFAILGKLAEGAHKTYCHPYGGFHSFNKDTLDAIAQLGVKYAFNVENREIAGTDYKNCKFYLPRFDCNFFPHGQAS